MNNYAAIIYVVLNIIGSWLFLLGIGMLYKVVGTLNFSHIAMRLDHMESNQTVTIISLIFLVAFSSKARLLYLCGYQSLRCTKYRTRIICRLMTKVGAYALIRFFTLIFNHHSGITHPLLVFMACLTMIIGALGVIAYKDIKKISLSSHIVDWIYHFRIRL